MGSRELDADNGTRTQSAFAPVPARGKATPTMSGTTLAVVAALAIAVAGAARFGSDGGMTPQPDQVAPGEIARRAAFTQSLRPVKVQGLSAAQQEHAIIATGLSGADRAALVVDLHAKRIRLVSLAFFDSDAEDGDVITVQSGGLSQSVGLLKTPVTVTVPAPVDGLVRIIGTSDGGGGVTVGIVTAAGPTALAVLSVGQVITIPVASE